MLLFFQQSLEIFLSEIKEFDIEVAYEIYSWQRAMPTIKFSDNYTEADFVEIKGWNKICNKWHSRNADFRSALDNLSRLGLIRLVPNTKPEYEENRYMITHCW